MMRRLRRGEDGAAAVELGLMLPILLVFLAFVAPIVKFGYDYMVLQRSASHGVRFASRADINPRCPDYAAGCASSELTRRPSPTEVASFVSDSSNGIVDVAQVTVAPDPRQTLPGEPIVVDINYEVSYGPMIDIANAVKEAFFGGGAFLPSPTTVTVSARGREE